MNPPTYQLEAGARQVVVQPDRSVDADAMETDFELFYNTMFPRIYTYVRCQVRDTEAAKDIVSQSFLKAYQHRTKAPSGDAMAHWLFRIVRNTLIDHWRVDGRRQMACVSLEELPQLADGVASPEMQVATRERQATLLRVMSGLPERDRTVLALKFAAYRTSRDIAAILHLSEGAVSMRLLRALRPEHVNNFGTLASCI